jgi:DNA-binding MurR/RpiR family transcriptional regulator
MGSIIQSYNENLHLLTETEERIIDYVLANPEYCLELSVYELSRAVKVSPSMIVKTSRKLGYNGYSQLRLALASELNLLVHREKSSVLVKDLEAYEELVSSTIVEAYARLDENTLLRAAQALEGAVNIDIYSFGFDSVAGHDLYLKMLQSGKRVQILENGYEQIISAYNLDKESVIVAISGTGTSKDLLDALNFSKKSGAFVISITPGGSKLSTYSNIALESYYSKLVFLEGGLITRVVQLMICDMLYMKFLEISGSKFEERYSRFREALDFKRRQIK